LGEGAVGGEDLAVTHPDGGGVGGRPQALAALQHAALAHLLAEGEVLVQDGLTLLGTDRLDGLLVSADQQCVSHGSSSSCQFITPTNSGRPNRHPGADSPAAGEPSFALN